MSRSLAVVFAEMDSILGICPCCGEVFRLSDARPHLKGRHPTSVFDELDGEAQRLEAAELRLQEREELLREEAHRRGQRQAKNRLKKIDPVFSGAGLDPQDVKLIFDPVEYVVFDGMSRGHVRQVLLMAGRARSREQEQVHGSIAAAIRKGNLEFRTLRVADNGRLEGG